jgi:hypothetical protein
MGGLHCCVDVRCACLGDIVDNLAIARIDRFFETITFGVVPFAVVEQLPVLWERSFDAWELWHREVAAEWGKSMDLAEEGKFEYRVK